MGSIIELGLGNIDVDWAKNGIGLDHSPLFGAQCVADVPYFYADNEVEYQEGASRRLAEMVTRLELLGHSLGNLRHHYDEFQSNSRARGAGPGFDDVLEKVRTIDLSELPRPDPGENDLGQLFAREVFERPPAGELNKRLRSGQYVERGAALANLHPWSILRLAAEHQNNLDLPVVWRYANVVNGGWVERVQVVRELQAGQRFLVVTEGSSDAQVLSKALSLLRPNIADFFTFVDMEAGYPFSGTGNLYRFCQGLASIPIINQVLVVYDNDAEGVENYQRTKELNLPRNMRVLRLPDLPALQSMKTLGPDGESRTDVNGKAASIECYLDIRGRLDTEPVVRWSNYNTTLGVYQGALLHKQEYVKDFLKLRTKEPGYDFSRISSVLDEVVSHCVSMAAELRARALQ